MASYLVKNVSGTFDHSKQPASFMAVTSIENRFFICECEEEPIGDFVVFMPDDVRSNHRFHLFKNGKKLWFDPFNGEVKFGDEVDAKRRRAIQYSEEQLQIRVGFFKWMVENVWLPDMIRLFPEREEAGKKALAELLLINDDEEARLFVASNFYYDL